MNIEDIFIGARVYVTDLPTAGKKTAVKVVDINASKDCINCEYEGITTWVWIGRVEPIPLTPEILEKDGWKNISDHTLKGCETFRLHIEQGSFDYTLTLKLRDYFRLDSYDDRVYTLCEVNFGFKYVHNLQNALRLCGIKKEITI